jgi:hypothetical protein
MAIGPSVGFMKKFNPSNMAPGQAKKKFRVNTKAPAHVAMKSSSSSNSSPKAHGIFDRAMTGLKIRKDMGD